MSGNLFEPIGVMPVGFCFVSIASEAFVRKGNLEKTPYPRFLKFNF